MKTVEKLSMLIYLFKNIHTLSDAEASERIASIFPELSSDLHDKKIKDIKWFNKSLNEIKNGNISILEKCAEALDINIDTSKLDKAVFYDLALYLVSGSFIESYAFNYALIMAYKCAVLFGDSKTAIDYLNHSVNEGDKKTIQPLHDACLFDIPLHQDWDTQLWSTMLPKLMKNKDIFHMGILNNLGKIQNAAIQSGKYYLETNPDDPEILKQIDLTKHLQLIQIDLNDCIHGISQLRKSIVSVNPEDQKDNIKIKIEKLEHEKEALKKAIKQTQNQIKKIKVPKPLTEATLSELREIALTIWFENTIADPYAANLFQKYGLTNLEFQEWLKLKLEAKNSDEEIPKVLIDGAEFDCSDMFIIKLDKDDPKTALLGKITACCQSLGGEGAACTKHGITSEHGGFYVLCKGKSLKQGESTRKINAKDIIAQSWAWRGHDGALVFDSIESQPVLRANAKYMVAVKKLFTVLASKCALERGISTVNVGIFGQTPRYWGYEYLNIPRGAPSFHYLSLDQEHGYYNINRYRFSKFSSSIPVDHAGYRDSEYQREIFNKEKPWFGMIYFDPESAIKLMKDKNVTDPSSMNTLFYLFAEIDNPEYLKLFIKIMGKDIFLDMVKETYLLADCSYCNAGNILRYLYDEKIDISSFLLDTPRKGTDDYDAYIKLLETYLPLGINVNVQDKKYGDTPLMRAIVDVDAGIIELLLKHGADLDIKSTKGTTARDALRDEPFLSERFKDYINSSKKPRF